MANPSSKSSNRSVFFSIFDRSVLFWVHIWVVAHQCDKSFVKFRRLVIEKQRSSKSGQWIGLLPVVMSNMTVSCHLGLNWTRPEQCLFVTELGDVCEGGGYLAYTRIYFCEQSTVGRVLVCALFMLLLTIYFLTLSTAADSFFCPSLRVIVDHLKISQNIAGVTLLAFGNGAPDIFSSIASVLSTSKPKIGLALGALLGSGVFLSTFVAALVILQEPFELMKRPMIRDLLFFILACGCTLSIVLHRTIHFWQACGFLCMYGLYASTVILGRYIRLWYRQQQNSTDTQTDQSVYATTQFGVAAANTANVYDPLNEEWQYPVFVAPSHSVDDYSPEDLQIVQNVECGSGVPACVKGWTQQLGLSLRPFSHLHWTRASWPLRLWLCAQTPVLLPLKLTIPVVHFELHNQNWFRSLTCVQCVLCPIFALTATQNLTLSVWSVPVMPFVLLLGVLMAVLVHTNTDALHPPKYHHMFAYIGFVMSVLWIYTVAREVVSVISMIAALTGLSEHVLGLTLLAWSNSLGDMISDVTVARQGLPRMAISACFGGPLLNLLVGVGLSFSVATLRQPDHSLKMMGDNQGLIVLLCFLLWSLGSSLLLMPVMNFRATGPFAYYLIAIYGTFLATSFAFEYHLVPEPTL